MPGPWSDRHRGSRRHDQHDPRHHHRPAGPTGALSCRGRSRGAACNRRPAPANSNRACHAPTIFTHGLHLQDAGSARQHLSGRVPRRGSLRRVRPGPDRPQMRRRRTGLFPSRDPRAACARISGELAAVRPPVAGPPSGAAPHASRSLVHHRQFSVRARRAAATRLPVAHRWHDCRFPLVRWHRTRNGAGKSTTIRLDPPPLRMLRRSGGARPPGPSRR